MIRIKEIIIISIIGIALPFQCTQPTVAGNSSSETTNGYIVGSLVKTDGSPATHTRIRLIPGNYNPIVNGPLPDSLINTTDSSGEFKFHVQGGEKFNIEGVQNYSGERVFISDVMVNKNDTFTVPRNMIQKPGSVKVFLPSLSTSHSGYLYCPGTTIWASVTNGSAMIDSVPAGSIPVLQYVDKTDNTLNRVVKEGICVTSANTTSVIDNNVWNYSRNLYFNTTLSGAAVSGNVYSFPVLIRLSAQNFDFTQAKSSGEDLRFIKANGSPLPYEIERWKSDARQAEIWVKVDTIYGNDSTHYITMLWGDSVSTGSSNGSAVFDTTNGFAAVWHLGDDCSDATAENHGGTNFGATSAAGMIGGAKRFNGKEHIEVPGLLGETQSITLSAWVSLDSTIGLGQEIISLGDAVVLRADQELPNATAGFHCRTISGPDTQYVFTNTGVLISKTGWRYLSYTVDPVRHIQSMYIDGILQRSITDTNAILYNGLGSKTIIGAHGHDKTIFNALGSIDEARVCCVVRSADWIKLCYMNQREQNALVIYK